MARKAGLQLTVGIDDAAALKKAKALMGILRSENAKMAAAEATESRRAASVALAEEKVQTQVTKTLAEQARVRKVLADALRSEISLKKALRQEDEAASRRRPGALTHFNRAIMSSRFALPGTNGNVMPLVGQTLRGGVAGIAGMALVGAIGGAGQLMASGVNEAANLEQSLMRLQGRTGATDAQLQQLRKTARELGADLTLPGIASTDAAQAIETLTAKGISLEDSMNGAKGALQLAVVGTLNFKEAAEITADALNQFQLQGTEATRVADAFAAASVKSGTPVRELYEALRAVGPVAKQAGASLEDTLTMLGMFGRSGLRGSDAGTSMKTFLLALQAPTKEAEAALKRLGVTAYNAEGQMRPLRSIIEDLANGLKGQTEAQQNAALKTIFGTDAIRAAVVAAGSGVKQFDEFKRAISEQGTAAKQAEAQTRGLKGALDGFDSTLKSLQEKSAEESGLVRLLTSIVSTGTEAITTLDALLTRADKIRQLGGNGGALGTLTGQMEDIRASLSTRREQYKRDAALPSGGLPRAQALTADKNDVLKLLGVGRNYNSEELTRASAILSRYGITPTQLYGTLSADQYLQHPIRAQLTDLMPRLINESLAARRNVGYDVMLRGTPTPKPVVLPSAPRSAGKGAYPARPSTTRPKKAGSTTPFDLLGVSMAEGGIGDMEDALRFQQQEQAQALAAKRAILEAELGRKEDAERARRAQAEATEQEMRLSRQTLDAKLQQAEDEENIAALTATARELYEQEVAAAKFARDEARRRLGFDAAQGLIKSLQAATSGGDIISALNSAAVGRAGGMREIEAQYSQRVNAAGAAQSGAFRTARSLAERRQQEADAMDIYTLEQLEAKRIEAERRVQEEIEKTAQMRREDMDWLRQESEEVLRQRQAINQAAAEPFLLMREQIARSVGESIGQFRSLKDFLEGWKGEVVNIFRSLVSEIITNWARVQIMGGKGAGLPGASGGAILGGLARALPGVGLAVGGATVLDRILGKNNPLRKLGIRGLATGGPAGAGEVFLGAEAGPEIFLGNNGAVNVLPTPGLYSPKVPGSVLSNRQVAKVAAALGGGGGKTIVHAPINVENVYEASDLHTLEAARVRKLSGGLAFS